MFANGLLVAGAACGGFPKLTDGAGVCGAPVVFVCEDDSGCLTRLAKGLDGVFGCEVEVEKPAKTFC